MYTLLRIDFFASRHDSCAINPIHPLEQHSYFFVILYDFFTSNVTLKADTLRDQRG